MIWRLARAALEAAVIIGALTFFLAVGVALASYR